MVECEFCGGEFVATVLALVVVASIDIFAVKFDGLFGEAVVGEQSDNTGDCNLHAYGLDPVGGGGELVFVFAEFGPGVEIVAHVAAVFDVDDFGEVTAEY